VRREQRVEELVGEEAVGEEERERAEQVRVHLPELSGAQRRPAQQLQRRRWQLHRDCSRPKWRQWLPISRPTGYVA
jgi:hypothetical protein